MSSRLERIQNKKAGKQGLLYLLLAIIIGVVTVGWGLKAVAGLAGLLINNDPGEQIDHSLKPTPPIISDIPEATYSAQINVTGFAQPGIDVKLFMNGAEMGQKLTTDSGTFEFSGVPITEGENTVYAYAVTSKDLMSEKSKEYIVKMDSTKPTVTLDSPKDGDVFRGQSQRIANFSGGVNELGSKVYIGERMVILSSEGKFSLPYQLVEGDQEIKIRAIDRAGNEGESVIKLRWEP